jgi:DSBA-like thioredoxin domain
MEPIKVEFMFDFGSPNAYLAEKVIPDIERRTGVKFEYVPVLLGRIYKLTNNRSPAEYLAGIKNKPEFMQLEMDRFIRRHNITSLRKCRPGFGRSWPQLELPRVRECCRGGRGRLKAPADTARRPRRSREREFRRAWAVASSTPGPW